MVSLISKTFWGITSVQSYGITHLKDLWGITSVQSYGIAHLKDLTSEVLLVYRVMVSLISKT